MLISRYNSILVLAILTLFMSCDRAPYPQGERIYKSQCANCHMEEGQGLGTLIPPIKDSDYYVNNYDQLVCIISNGLSGKIIVNGVEYEEEMPPARKLTEAELSNLINYMNSQWYPTMPAINMTNIKEDLEKCKAAE